MAKRAWIFIVLICVVLSITKKTSIVIVVEDHSVLYLRQSLRSLEDFDNLSNLEVIIVPIGKMEYENKDAFHSVISSREAMKQFKVIISNSQYDNIPKAFNRGVQEAKGDYIILMLDSTEIPGYSTIQSIVKILEKQNDIGVVGGKLLFPDDTIYHAGIEFVLQKNVARASTWDYWSSTYGLDDSLELPGLSHRLQGYIWKDKRSMKEAEVPVITKALMGVKKSDFLEIDGFNESYSISYFDADFCLKMSQNLGKKILYNPNIIALFNNRGKAETEYDVQDEEVKKDVILFDEMWGDYVRSEIEKNYKVSNITLVWNMECGAGQVLGFTTEAINFIMALHKKIRLKIEVNKEDECKRELKKTGAPLEMRKTLARLMNRQVPHNQETITIIHRDPGRYNYFVNSGNSQDYIIGRSMYETDKIPSDWPASCNSWKIDKIWVPTEFNRETFSENGVNSTKLDVVPELLDTYHFDPSIHSPLLEIPPSNDVFKFLSIMKWESRKGWDILLRAYFDEFRENNTDRVVLYIVSRLDEQAMEKYNKFLDEYLLYAGINNTDLLPKVVIMNMMLPYTKLPSLYKSVNCLVLPSHGEGWGLPLIEAMSMSLPTIGTNWSGTTGFMNEQNSFLVSVSGMEPATIEGHLWATPDIQVLRQHMRTVFEYGPEVIAKTKRARTDVVKNFSLDAVGEIVLNKIKEIQPILAQNRITKQTLKANESSIPPSWFITNPPSWTISWDNNYLWTPSDIFVENGKKKYKININS